MTATANIAVMAGFSLRKIQLNIDKIKQTTII